MAVTTTPIQFLTDKWGIITLGGISHNPSTDFGTGTTIDILSGPSGIVKAAENNITDVAQLALRTVPRTATSSNPFKVSLTNGNYFKLYWTSSHMSIDFKMASGESVGQHKIYDGGRFSHAFLFAYPPALTTTITSQSEVFFMVFKGDATVEYNSFGGITDPPRAFNFFNGASKFNFGDDSKVGGGQGMFDDTTETIDFPNLPTGSALETGLINMYECDATDLQGLGKFLWSTDFFTNILKVFNDPMEAFISLNLFPVSPSKSAVKQTIKFGNLNAVTLVTETGATEFHQAYPLLSQYVDFNCGSVNVNEYFGSALDYNPYTQVQIFLPFIGFQSLSVDDVMNATISLRYHIDMLTGTCTAMLKCDRTAKTELHSVMYSYAGSMNMAIPISAGNYSTALTTLTTGLAGIGIGLATGGTGMAVAGAVSGSAMNMLNAKTNVQRSGGIVMNAGALGNLTPYIIITRPVQHKPTDYQKFKGWESNITVTLSELREQGYTEISYVHVDGMTATDDEKTEIENLLKEGVIL